jgi:hypothetical protein
MWDAAAWEAPLAAPDWATGNTITKVVPELGGVRRLSFRRVVGVYSGQADAETGQKKWAGLALGVCWCMVGG